MPDQNSRPNRQAFAGRIREPIPLDSAVNHHQLLLGDAARRHDLPHGVQNVIAGENVHNVKDLPPGAHRVS